MGRTQKAPGSWVLLGAGWGSVLRGGVGQLKADGNIGLAADGPCADAQRGELQRYAVFLCAAAGAALASHRAAPARAP